MHLADDQGWTDWPKSTAHADRGTYTDAALPTIKRYFVDEGFELRRMYSSTVCGPSRRSVFTGRTVNRLGLHNTDCPSLPLGVPTLADELGRAGYKTVMLGKWHMGFYQGSALPGRRGVQEGEVYFAGANHHGTHTAHDGSVGTHTDESIRDVSTDGGKSYSAIFDHSLIRRGVDEQGGYAYFTDPANRPSPSRHSWEASKAFSGPGGRPQHWGSLARDRAIEYIDRHDNDDKASPLFLYMPWSMPHKPHTPERADSVARMHELQCEDDADFGWHRCDPRTDDYYRKCLYVLRAFPGCETCRLACEAAGGAAADYAMYQAMIHELDGHVGAIIDRLKSKLDAGGTSMWDETLMIWQSDNGGMPQVNFPLQGGKFHMSEGGVRVRASLSGGILPPGLRGASTEAFFHQSDWMPTLCHAAGVDCTGRSPGHPIGDVTGVSMWPVIGANDASRAPERTVVVAATCADHDWCTDVYLGKLGGRADFSTVQMALMSSGVRDGKPYLYKLAHQPRGDCEKVGFTPCQRLGTSYTDWRPHGRGNEPATSASRDCYAKVASGVRGCLFDVMADPEELRELSHSAEHADVKAELGAAYDAEIASMYNWDAPADRGVNDVATCVDIGLRYAVTHTCPCAMGDTEPSAAAANCGFELGAWSEMDKRPLAHEVCRADRLSWYVAVGMGRDPGVGARVAGVAEGEDAFCCSKTHTEAYRGEWVAPCRCGNLQRTT